MNLGHKRAHVAAPTSVAGLQAAHALLDLRNELVADRVDGENDRDRHAALACRTEAGVDGLVGCEIKISIGEDQHVVLGATECLNALAIRRAALVDVLRDRSRADERDALDVFIVEQGIDRLLVTVHDIEDAVGQAGVLPHLSDQVGGRRILLGRLDDDGVARSNGDREEPHRHHGREVERRDDANDAKGLAN